MLIVVRHGRTAANAAGLLLGRADPPLDDLGRRQARALGPLVAGAARVVTSPLRRARETAAPWGLPTTVDEAWIELDYGEWDGLALGSLPADTWGRWRADVTLRPPGGETLVELGERVRSACAGLAEEAAERDVVVVTHVSPVKAALCWALGVGDEVAWRAFVPPASVMRIASAPHGPILRSFAELAPLDPVEAP